MIKDRQYTTQGDSLARRSCQSAMYHVVEAMTRWITPILSFTADEVWENLPGGGLGDSETAESVHLADLPAEHNEWINDTLGARWEQLVAGREAAEVGRGLAVDGDHGERAVVVRGQGDRSGESQVGPDRRGLDADRAAGARRERLGAALIGRRPSTPLRASAPVDPFAFNCAPWRLNPCSRRVDVNVGQRSAQ